MITVAILTQMERNDLVDRRVENAQHVPVQFRRRLAKRDTDELLTCDVDALSPTRAVGMCERFGLDTGGSPEEAKDELRQIQSEVRS